MKARHIFLGLLLLMSSPIWCGMTMPSTDSMKSAAGGAAPGGDAKKEEEKPDKTLIQTNTVLANEMKRDKMFFEVKQFVSSLKDQMKEVQCSIGQRLQEIENSGGLR